MVEAQNAALHGELVSCDRRTVAEYLEQWLTAVQASLEPAGCTNYRTCLTLYVLPRLGHVQLAALTPLTLSALYADLLRAGGRGGRPLSNTTVRLVHGVVRKALNDAVLRGLPAKNPARRAAVPKRRRPVMTVWTPEQASAFPAATTDDRMQACWLLALSTGMRRGELTGLSWSDLDLERGRLQVTSQRTTDSDYQVVTKESKASSRRAVALAPHTVAALRRNSAGLARERLASGAAWTDSGLVFVDELGGGLHPQRLTDLFQRACGSAGLPRIRVHDLRHTSATLASSRRRTSEVRAGAARARHQIHDARHLQPRPGRHAAQDAAQVEALLLPQSGHG